MFPDGLYGGQPPVQSGNYHRTPVRRHRAHRRPRTKTANRSPGPNCRRNPAARSACRTLLEVKDHYSRDTGGSNGYYAIDLIRGTSVCARDLVGNLTLRLSWFQKRTVDMDVVACSERVTS